MSTPSEWCTVGDTTGGSGNTPKRSKLTEFYVFDTATIFYGQSTVLRLFYRAMFSRESVSDFAKLCLSKRCKLATMNNICKFVREYHDLALKLKPIIPFTGEDAIVCMARRFATLHERGPSVHRMGRYALLVAG